MPWPVMSISGVPVLLRFWCDGIGASFQGSGQWHAAGHGCVPSAKGVQTVRRVFFWGGHAAIILPTEQEGSMSPFRGRRRCLAFIPAAMSAAMLGGWTSSVSASPGFLGKYDFAHPMFLQGTVVNIEPTLSFYLRKSG